MSFFLGATSNYSDTYKNNHFVLHLSNAKNPKERCVHIPLFLDM